MLLPLETNDLRTPGLLYQQIDFGFFCTSKSPYRLNSNYIIRISLITRYKIKCNSDDVKTRQFIYARNPELRGGGEGGLEQRRKTSEQSVLFCVDSSGVFGFLIS